MSRSNRNINNSLQNSESSSRQTSILLYLTEILSSREEGSTEERTNEQTISGRNLLHLMLNRDITSPRNDENRVEEAFISRTRRRRYHFYDEQAESYDEMINPIPDEEYVDFRTYPLMIDWKEIENDMSEAYDIFEKYGYLGVSCITSLSKHNNIKFRDKFYKNILSFYLNLMEKNKSDSLQELEEFIKDLPSLQQIKKLIFLKLISKKELILIKLLLDIYSNYYLEHDGPLFQNILKDYIPTATYFYNSLSEEDIKYIYDKINGMTDISYLMRNKLNSIISKKRHKYLETLSNMKTEKLKLLGDVIDLNY